MKAARFHRYGPPDVVTVEDVPKPEPKDNDVLIRVRAATVATADCEVRSFTFFGWLWLPVRLGFGVFRPRSYVKILGQELAGDVETVGRNVKNFATGDRVVAAISGFGAHAEYKCLPANGVIAKMPADAAYADAAAFSAFALNALHFIRKADLKPGQKILINGAGSSIGTTAVQLAKHAGAAVTAVDSAGKLAMLREIGADHVIDYAREDFTKSGDVYDIILDVIGRSSFSRSLRSLKETGKYIIANPRTLPMLRGWLHSKKKPKKVMFAFAKERAEDLAHLMDLFAAGVLKPVIDRRYMLDEIVEAHAYVQSGEKKGHVVLLIGEPQQ